MVKPFESKPATLSTKHAPGFCVMCGAPATTIASFKVPDAVVLQRYCDKCLPKAAYDVK